MCHPSRICERWDSNDLFLFFVLTHQIRAARKNDDLLISDASSYRVTWCFIGENMSTAPPPAPPDGPDLQLGNRVTIVERDVDALKQLGNRVTVVEHNVDALKQLDNRITVVEHDVAALKNSKAAKIAVMISIFGGVIAILSGGYTLWDALHKSPRTSVVGPSSLEISYNPKSRVLTTRFSFILQNLGNADDGMSGASVQVIDQLNGSLAPISDIKCAFGMSSVEGPPLVVSKSTSVAGTCTASTLLQSLSMEAFSSAGTKEFKLDMPRGSERDLSWSGCFALDPDSVNEIAKGKDSVVRKFPFKSCG